MLFKRWLFNARTSNQVLIFLIGFQLTLFSVAVYADSEDLRNGGDSSSSTVLTEARTPLGLNAISALLTRPLAVSASYNQPYSPPYDKLDANLKRRCPLCDSSVYSYCSEKLLHDACCCNNPYDTTLPYECRFADCSFLHANSCREHRLITACCCTNLYLAKNPH